MQKAVLQFTFIRQCCRSYAGTAVIEVSLSVLCSAVVFFICDALQRLATISYITIASCGCKVT